jgi:circadian clock protein KaiC
MSAIDRMGATRVVIDSLSEIELYLAPEVRADLRLAVFRTLTALAKRGVSTVVAVGIDEMHGMLQLSPDELCFLTDAVIGMRYAEISGTLRKFLTVVKVRGCDHSNDIREYHITDRGIEVEPTPAPFEAVLTGWPRPRGT